MTDETESLMLAILRNIQGKIARIEEELQDIKLRVSNVETGQSLIRQELVLQSTQISQLSHRMDRFDERLARIERRLDLIEV